MRNTGIAGAVMVVAGATALICIAHSGATAARARSADTPLRPSPSIVRQAAPAVDPGGPATGPGTVSTGPGTGPSPATAAPGPSPDAGVPVPPAGTVAAFGLIKPGRSGLLLARARRSQPGGPETLRAVDVARYRGVPLAAGAQLWVTVPIYQGQLPDVLRGVQVTPGRFGVLYRAEDARFGPILDRAHMFDVRSDARGRVVWLHQIFSP